MNDSANTRTSEETANSPVYNLSSLPTWRPNDDTPGEGAKWSGRGRLATPPAIGAEVMIRMNDFGLGTVTGYFVEAGYLGVYVTPHDPPTWWKKQIKEDGRARKDAMIFGIELASRSAASFVAVAADDISRLRRCDVYRVLEEAREGDELVYVADFVRRLRPDLRDVVEEAQAELQGS